MKRKISGNNLWGYLMSKEYLITVFSESDDHFSFDIIGHSIFLSDKTRQDIKYELQNLEKKYNTTRPKDIEINIMRCD